MIITKRESKKNQEIDANQDIWSHKRKYLHVCVHWTYLLKSIKKIEIKAHMKLSE